MPSGIPASSVDRYLARIAYDGAREPTLATLQAIVACHTVAIAFENLTPLTAAAVRLEPAALAEKMVAGRRGGYCFEHNLLLGDALEQLGFHTVGLAARVVWNRPEGLGIPPRTHMLVRVELDDGSYVVDTGFGSSPPSRSIVPRTRRSWTANCNCRRCLVSGGVPSTSSASSHSSVLISRWPTGLCRPLRSRCSCST